MALAFELPEHLPRGGQAQDSSTHILAKVGEATHQSLNAALAASWLAELDSTIHDTKTRISKRINDDFPAFERQFESSTSVQTCLQDLSTNIDRLTDSLNEPKTGILPTLVQALTTHGTLAEQANDSDVTYAALAHLLRIREELDDLSSRVENGELPESAQACGRVLNLVLDSPSPLERAEVMSEIKKRYRTLNDRVQEQLGDAYARSVKFSSSADAVSLTVHSPMTVPPTLTQITLPAILSSLAPEALSARLSVLRRDFMSKFMESALLSSHSLTSSTEDTSSTLSLSLSSSSSTPLQSLQTLFDFVNSHIFPHLPPAHATFPSTFHGPVTSAILTHLLEPSIPSSLASLPSFLVTVDDAIRFEDSLLPADARDKPIARWAGDVAGHYEKKRRETMISEARSLVVKPEDGATIRAEIIITPSPTSPADSTQDQVDDEDLWDFHREASDEGRFDASGSGSSATPPQNGVSGDAHSPSKAAREHDNLRDVEDASDGWGWGDDADADDRGSSPSEPASQAPPGVPKSQDVEEEDDPWDDDGWATQPAPSSPPRSDPQPDPEPEPEPQLPAPKRAPKMAKRLEKFSAKAKGLSASNTPVASPVVAAAPKPPPPPPAPLQQREVLPAPRPRAPNKAPEKETYLVSVRAKTVLEIAESLMREGQELMQSNVFAEHVSAKTTVPGQFLLSAAPSVLDLYRALYPVTHSSALASDADLAMRWSNDCKYLSDQVASLRSGKGPALAEERWVEAGERLKMLGEAWFEDVVVRQQEGVLNMLVGAQGFANVSNGARFEECKSAIQQVLEDIKSLARQWKVTLTKSAYLHAMGQIVDDALFRVMDDVLSLDDIPEADSERLSALCEMLAPLEELFVDALGEQSVVGSHVPLWFKFSYLSWLIKGSIADLSYLFDQGMLVDYEIDELVRLLRALFAETPLRESTITKISKGHPVPNEGFDY